MRKIFLALTGALALSAAAASARAEVTVLGWPGGPEEVALRAVAELYNGTASDNDWAGSTTLDAALAATSQGMAELLKP